MLVRWRWRTTRNWGDPTRLPSLALTHLDSPRRPDGACSSSEWHLHLPRAAAGRRQELAGGPRAGGRRAGLGRSRGERAGGARVAEHAYSAAERARGRGSFPGLDDGRPADDLGALPLSRSSSRGKGYRSDARRLQVKDYSENSGLLEQLEEARVLRRCVLPVPLPPRPARSLTSLARARRTGSTVPQGLVRLPLAVVVLNEHEMAQRCAFEGCDKVESVETRERYKRCSSCSRRYYVRPFSVSPRVRVLSRQLTACSRSARPRCALVVLLSRLMLLQLAVFGALTHPVLPSCNSINTRTGHGTSRTARTSPPGASRRSRCGGGRKKSCRLASTSSTFAGVEEYQPRRFCSSTASERRAAVKMLRLGLLSLEPPSSWTVVRPPGGAERRLRGSGQCSAPLVSLIPLALPRFRLFAHELLPTTECSHPDRPRASSPPAASSSSRPFAMSLGIKLSTPTQCATQTITWSGPPVRKGVAMWVQGTVRPLSLPLARPHRHRS